MVQKIKKQSGYPTTDGKMFDKYVDAIKHQAEVDLNAALEAGVEADQVDDFKKFIDGNHEAVMEYVKHHCAKKAPARKPAKKKAEATEKPKAVA